MTMNGVFRLTAALVVAVVIPSCGDNGSEPTGLEPSETPLTRESTTPLNAPAFSLVAGSAYEIVDLGTFGIAVATNEAGQVVGRGSAGAFLWHNGVMTDLDPLGGNLGIAVAINDAGQVVGNGRAGAFLWQDGVITRLGSLGGKWSSPEAINEAGQVVGRSSTAANQQHAFLWQDGVMTDLGTLGGRRSRAAAINEAGQVVGTSSTAAGEEQEHAFLWHQGVMTDLGTLGRGQSFARAINDAGQVVGYSRTAAFQPSHAFLWQDGLMTDLGTPSGIPEAINEAGQVVAGRFLWQDGATTDLGTLGGTWSRAQAINEAGQVVGESQTAAGQTHAFLWQHGVMTDLGTLGGTFSEARAINDANQIVGWSDTAAGQRHAVVWPSALVIGIDIKPGSDPNSINLKSKGMIPVAILTTSTHAGDSFDFSAADVNPATVRLGPAGPAGAAPVHDFTNTQATELHRHDVDDDGDTDLVLHFNVQDAGLEPHQAGACLTGATFGNQFFRGCAAVRVIEEQPPGSSILHGPLDQVTFFLNHSDFRGLTGTWTFKLNGVTLGTSGTSVRGICNLQEPSVSFSDAQLLRSAWKNSGPNTLTVEVNASPSLNVAVGYIRATLKTRSRVATVAVFDATGGDASNRKLCDGFVWNHIRNVFEVTIE